MTYPYRLETRNISPNYAKFNDEGTVTESNASELFDGISFDSLNQVTYSRNIRSLNPTFVNVSLDSQDGTDFYFNHRINYNQSGGSISLQLDVSNHSNELARSTRLDNWFVFLTAFSIAYASEGFATQRILTTIATETDPSSHITAAASFRDTAFYQGNGGIRSYEVFHGTDRDIITTQLIFPSVEIASVDAIHSSEAGLSFVDVFNEQNPRVMSIIKTETNEDFGLREFGSLFRFQDYDMVKSNDKHIR